MGKHRFGVIACSTPSSLKMDALAGHLADLASGADDRAEAAALSLPAFGQPAITALAELATAESADTRWWALRALAGFEQSDEITQLLLAALEDESNDVRQCAALGLCHQPHPRAVTSLICALSGPDAMTAKIAADALIRIGAQAVPALLNILQTGSAAARLEAVRALAEIKDPRAIPALLAAQNTDSAVTQYWAKQGLDALGLGMVYLKPE